MFSIFMRINSQPDVILEIRNIFRTRWSSVAFNRKHIDIMIKSSRHFVSAVIGTVLRRNLIIVCLREGELKCGVVVFFGQGYFKCKKKSKSNKNRASRKHARGHTARAAWAL